MMKWRIQILLRLPPSKEHRHYSRSLSLWTTVQLSSPPITVDHHPQLVDTIPTIEGENEVDDNGRRLWPRGGFASCWRRSSWIMALLWLLTNDELLAEVAIYWMEMKLGFCELFFNSVVASMRRSDGTDSIVWSSPKDFPDQRLLSSRRRDLEKGLCSWITQTKEYHGFAYFSFFLLGTLVLASI